MATVNANATEQRVFVMRHGERLDNTNPAKWNNIKGDRGYDPPLTERGIKECNDIASKRLKDKGISIVYSSPFIRCLQTAWEVCKALQLPGVTVSNGICEILEPMFGIDVPDPVVPALDVSTTHHINILEKDKKPLPKFPESYESALSRYDQSIKAIADSCYPNNLVLVTHAYGVQQGLKIGGETPRCLPDFAAHIELVRDNKNGKWRVESKFRVQRQIVH